MRNKFIKIIIIALQFVFICGAMTYLYKTTIDLKEFKDENFSMYRRIASENAVADYYNNSVDKKINSDLDELKKENIDIVKQGRLYYNTWRNIYNQTYSLALKKCKYKQDKQLLNSFGKQTKKNAELYSGIAELGLGSINQNKNQKPSREQVAIKLFETANVYRSASCLLIYISPEYSYPEIVEISDVNGQKEFVAEYQKGYQYKDYTKKFK